MKKRAARSNARPTRPAPARSVAAAPVMNEGNNYLMSGIFNQPSNYGQAPLSGQSNLGYNNAYTPLTLNRLLITYTYMTHGIVQTMIDQPVEDAFRNGLKILCDELDRDDLELLYKTFEREDLHHVKDAMRWAKLFGGAALIIATDEDPTSNFDPESIRKGDPLSFVAADRWEIAYMYLNAPQITCPYNYYGIPMNKTRVMRVMGKEAPSFIRAQLQGWGMSELERTIRPLNSYVKNEDVIYQLLDEAKTDVWMIEGFNANILAGAAQGQMHQRLQTANLLKNYHRAIIMDKDDAYEQKQISFAGLPEILKENRIGAAAAVRMPMTKLFGLSAAGFNSGEDDLENYNALIESQVRAKCKKLVLEVLNLRCRQLFGFAPDSLDIEFYPLRVLSEEGVENVKTQKFNRFSMQYQQGMYTDKEYADIMVMEQLTPIEPEVARGTREMQPPAAPMSYDKPQVPVTSKVRESSKAANK